MFDSLTARVTTIIALGTGLLTIGSCLYTFLGFPLSDIILISAMLCLVVYLSFLFDGIRTQLKSINETLKEGFKLKASNPSDPRRKGEEPTGAGALAGLIAGGFVGFAGGPVGVIIGAIIGGLIGNQIEYENLKKRRS